MISIAISLGLSGPAAVLSEALLQLGSDGALNLEDWYAMERAKARLKSFRFGLSATVMGVTVVTFLLNTVYGLSRYIELATFIFYFWPTFRAKSDGPSSVF